MFKRFTPIITLTAVCWLVFALNALIFQGRLAEHGIIPRHLAGLTGIIWAPFLHASFQHLAANTVPLLVLGAIICARGQGEFAIVTTGGILLGGILTWLFARSASHIGASGLIFCYFGYLASLAWFKRTFGTLCLSVVCILAYGGMITSILPRHTPVSWESHLAGLVTGVILGAFMSQSKRPPARAANPGTSSM
jgi:membrane associated rhomboid family serine protease